MTIPPRPRYHGLSGSLIYGCYIGAVMAGLGVMACAAMFFLTGSGELAKHMIVRFTLLAVSAGASAALARWICGGSADKLMTKKTVRGDIGGIMGWGVGFFLVGYLAGDAPTGGEGSEALILGKPVAIAGPTIAGKPYDLQELKGKVVLVDFWATWCGPCVKELPTVHAAYDKHHADGLEIVSVSFDMSRPDLVRFLDSHPTPWPQIFFDDPELQGFDNPNGKRYGIDSIPTLFLVGPDGNLIAKGFRGSDIDRQISLALGKPVSGSDRFASIPERLLVWFFHCIMNAPLGLLLAGTLASVAAFALLERLLRGRPPAFVPEAQAG